MTNRRLEGFVALVTGGGRGIGAAIARAAGREGARVAVTDVAMDSAVTVAEGLRGNGVEAEAWEVDVADPRSWEQGMEGITQRFGPPTVLFANAAHTAKDAQVSDRTVLEIETELWDRVMAVNVRGAMLSCKAVLPGMISARSGSIVITSSVVSYLPNRDRTAYAASKAALNSLVRSVATGFGDAEIRCNGIAPGLIETEALSAILGLQRRKDLLSHLLLPRFGTPEEVASIAIFLASEESRLITGQILIADGGLSCHFPTTRDSSY